MVIFMHNKKTFVAELALLLALAAIFAYGTALERQQQGISNKLIRLHVVANSDTDADQAQKLEVRDTVLDSAQRILEHAENQAQAKALLRDNLDQLTAAAQSVLGQSVPVQVTLNRELFGTRHYDGFSLPGGYYDALRVTIGSGNGKNWWCVVYPQICTAATAQDQRTVAVMGGLTDEDVALLSGDTPEYQLKFRTLELLEDLLGWFRGGADGIPVSR
jgi:stage II sporulation protein R